MQKSKYCWWLLQFVNQNIEIKNKKIIFGLKEPTLLHKTGIPLQEWI